MRDAGSDTGRGCSAVAFEVELVFEDRDAVRLERDGPEDLAQGLKNWVPGAGFLAFTGFAEEIDLGGVEVGSDPVGMRVQQVVGCHLRCSGKGVEIGVHEGLQVRVG